MELQRGLESLNQVPTPTVEHGLDFYHDVRHFEIELIKHALMVVEGHQGKAARLLNLNASNLLTPRTAIRSDQLTSRFAPME